MTTDLTKLHLRVRVGQLYNCYVGLASGHYLLDLRQSNHVRGGKRLAGLSTAESKVEWSEVEWGGVEWGGVEWAGVGWGRVG